MLLVEIQLCSRSDAMSLFENFDDFPSACPDCPDDRGIYCPVYQLAFRTALDAPFSHLGCHRDGGRSGTEQQIADSSGKRREEAMREDAVRCDGDTVLVDALARANVMGRLLADFDRIKRLLSMFMTEAVQRERIMALDRIAFRKGSKKGHSRNRRKTTGSKSLGKFAPSKKKKNKNKKKKTDNKKSAKKVAKKSDVADAVIDNLRPESPCAQELPPLSPEDTANNDLEETLRRGADLSELPSLLRDMQDPNEYEENAVGLNVNYHMPQL